MQNCMHPHVRNASNLRVTQAAFHDITKCVHGCPPTHCRLTVGFCQKPTACHTEPESQPLNTPQPTPTISQQQAHMHITGAMALSIRVPHMLPVNNSPEPWKLVVLGLLQQPMTHHALHCTCSRAMAHALGCKQHRWMRHKPQNNMHLCACMRTKPYPSSCHPHHTIHRCSYHTSA